MLSVTAINNTKSKDKPYKLADEKGLYWFDGLNDLHVGSTYHKSFLPPLSYVDHCLQ